MVSAAKHISVSALMYILICNSMYYVLMYLCLIYVSCSKSMIKLFGEERERERGRIRRMNNYRA